MRQRKNILTSVGIEPTTFGLDLPVRFPLRSKDFFFASCGSLFPLLGLTPSGLFMGLSSTIIYTSELILCSAICVPSATRHNIHMYPYFLFATIHHLKSSPTFSVRPCSSVGRVTVDLIRRSWVRFPPRSKDFFFASCGSLFPFTRAKLFMGLSNTIIYTSELILCSTICVPSATRHNIHKYSYIAYMTGKKRRESRF